ncbi:hypothetical protein HDU87_001500 [Geranomyces variabilis]|uniref:Uncharacterized protein n=1 Tax=Geranomyces variabilis TaxID=109894 RepID=A0AAD5TCN0_9FUNG|nr:hypothetical protein HDU87_001500 [Geranomyces variabilis]
MMGNMLPKDLKRDRPEIGANIEVRGQKRGDGLYIKIPSPTPLAGPNHFAWGVGLGPGSGAGLARKAQAHGRIHRAAKEKPDSSDDENILDASKVVTLFEVYRENSNAFVRLLLLDAAGAEEGVNLGRRLESAVPKLVGVPAEDDDTEDEVVVVSPRMEKLRLAECSAVDSDHAQTILTPPQLIHAIGQTAAVVVARLPAEGTIFIKRDGQCFRRPVGWVVVPIMRSPFAQRNRHHQKRSVSTRHKHLGLIQTARKR